MILFIFSLQESYQTRGKELFVPNLNYRLQCYFNTDHVFLKTNPDQSLSLNLLPGFFFAFPTQQIINVRKSIKEYTIVQSTFAKFMQTYNLSSLETNFLITGGMQSLKSFDAVSDEYLETEVEIDIEIEIEKEIDKEIDIETDTEIEVEIERENEIDKEI